MVKVISFFNEKGGTGKSTMTALFACYLRYSEGEQVAVMDFDHPNYQISNFRKIDEGILAKDHDCAFARMVKQEKYSPFIVKRIESKGGFTPEVLENTASYIRKLKEGNRSGYLLLDFPGRFLTSDPAYYLAKRGLVDLFVMPVDSDRQSMSSALAIITRVFRNEQFIKATGRDREQDVVILLNRETQKERSGRNNRYDSMEKIFGMMNIPVIGCRMREILIARRDADTFGFVRNTLCWPQQNIRKACPYIGKIFDEIIYRAKGEWDETKKEQVYGTPQAKQ